MGQGGGGRGGGQKRAVWEHEGCVGSGTRKQCRSNENRFYALTSLKNLTTGRDLAGDGAKEAGGGGGEMWGGIRCSW